MVKILLCGAVQGHWELLFERARKLNAKGTPFAALVCVGRCFPLPLAYLPGGDKTVPLPTYFLPANEKPLAWQEDAQQTALYDQISTVDGSTTPMELAPSFFCLAGAGVTTISGLQVAYISGTEAQDAGAKATPFTYSRATVDSLVTKLTATDGLGNVDFLFTADYPANFQHLLPEQQLPEALQALTGSTPIGQLVQLVHPKYHLTSPGGQADVFYQRLPYVSEVTGTGHKQLTRLIGLSGVNTLKDKTRKYLHALQVTPSNQQSDQERHQIDIPAGTTQNPYLHALLAASTRPESTGEPLSKRRKVDPAAGGGLSAEQIAQLTARSHGDAQFFYDQKLAKRGQRKGGLLPGEQTGNQRRNQRITVPERSECWFCLATPTLERHLIVSIGQEAYLAMPKGAICGDHVLIVPIAHEASTLALSEDTWKEIGRFKAALRRYFATQDKEMLVWDRNVATLGATHCHLQVLGVPKAKAAAARRVFEAEGDKYHVKFEELQGDQDGDEVAPVVLREATQEKPFFYAEVPDGEGGQVKLLNRVEGKHYMQFGRHAAACTLGMPRRANWKFCVLPKPEEEKLTQSFKSHWKPFDFTLEDE